MSVEIQLSGNRLSGQAWEKVFLAWAQQSENEPYTEPAFEEGVDGECLAQIWRRGSIRSTIIAFNSDARMVEAILPALASRADWVNAFTILRTGVQHGGGSLSIEGEPIPVEELTKEQAIRRGASSFIRAARMMRPAEGSVLPIYDFEIPLGPHAPWETTPENFTAKEKALAVEVEKYATAYRAGGLAGLGPPGLAMWSGIPTMIDRNTQMVDCCLDVGETISYPPRSAVVPLPALLELLGDRAVVLGPSIYLPALTEADVEPLAALAGTSESAPVGGATLPRGDQVHGAQAMAEFVATLVGSMLGGTSPDDLEEQCVALGHERVMVQHLFAGVALVMDGVARKHSAKKISKQVGKKLRMPDAVVQAVIVGTASAMKRHAESRGG